MQRCTTRMGLLSLGSFWSFTCAATRSSTEVAGFLMISLSSRRRVAYFATSAFRCSFLFTFEVFAIGGRALTRPPRADQAAVTLEARDHHESALLMGAGRWHRDQRRGAPPWE